jgi:hypothetical protein
MLSDVEGLAQVTTDAELARRSRSELEPALYAHNLTVTDHAAWQPILFRLRDETGAYLSTFDFQAGEHRRSWSGVGHLINAAAISGEPRDSLSCARYPDPVVAAAGP